MRKKSFNQICLLSKFSIILNIFFSIFVRILYIILSFVWTFFPITITISLRIDIHITYMKPIFQYQIQIQTSTNPRGDSNEMRMENLNSILIWIWFSIKIYSFKHEICVLWLAEGPGQDIFRTTHGNNTQSATRSSSPIIQPFMLTEFSIILTDDEIEWDWSICTYNRALSWWPVTPHIPNDWSEFLEYIFSWLM